MATLEGNKECQQGHGCRERGISEKRSWSEIVSSKKIFKKSFLSIYSELTDLTYKLKSNVGSFSPTDVPVANEAGEAAAMGMYRFSEKELFVNWGLPGSFI